MEYRILRSKRRTLAIELQRDASLLVRAPYATPLSEIEGFVAEHAAWIESKRRRLEALSLPPLTKEEESRLRARAVGDLPTRTAAWAERMGIDYAGVKITSARQRLGSCNSRGGIAYSFRLMQYPDEVIDYVVVHELAHRKEMNHSARFYAIIERYLPDYRRRIERMKSWPLAL
ncbi:MAG: M48 family metallopeptidase [Clostridia bacterium]|nr:M48 family metallopeptidase [Clostridia bacterium]